MFLGGVLSMLIEFDGGFDHFVWMVPPVALAFSIFFLEVRRKWISEVVHLFLILTIIFYQYSFLLK
jgi:hypothetical protein